MRFSNHYTNKATDSGYHCYHYYTTTSTAAAAATATTTTTTSTTTTTVLLLIFLMLVLLLQMLLLLLLLFLPLLLWNYNRHWCSKQCNGTITITISVICSHTHHNHPTRPLLQCSLPVHHRTCSEEYTCSTLHWYRDLHTHMCIGIEQARGRGDRRVQMGMGEALCSLLGKSK